LSFNSYQLPLLLFLSTSPLLPESPHSQFFLSFHPSVSFLTFCLSILLYFPPPCSHCFFCFSHLFVPFSKSPCHLSSLLSSIYICLFLPCPSLTSLHSSLSVSFTLFFPCALFSLSLSLALCLFFTTPTLSVVLFLANHHSFSFVSSDAAALFCKLNPSLSLSSPHPPSLTLHSSLSHSAVPVAGWGGWLGASVLLQTHCWAVMVVLCVCVCLCVCVVGGCSWWRMRRETGIV